jgi:FO synthase
MRLMPYAHRVLDGQKLSAAELERLVEEPIRDLCQAAALVRDVGFGFLVTYSRKVFIPATQLCRDVCHYCTFAKSPAHLKSPYLSKEDVLSIARAGRERGCKEALFTLGEKPELRYSAASEWLNERGYQTTIDYVADMAEVVLKATGLLPHINAGTLSELELMRLRSVSASMGLMLETSSTRLCERGMPHHGSVDKAPAVRLETLRAAGRLKIPMTSGVLIGIGETWAERVESLVALRDIHEEFANIQEVIIQNFRAKVGTKMEGHPEPPLNDLIRTIALARLALGPTVSIQAPPNLTKGSLEPLIAAGINDWGGVSPVTPDHVNPEAPWPVLDSLAKSTSDAFKHLAERLTVYPRYIEHGNVWLDPRVAPAVLMLSDAHCLAREDDWRAGDGVLPPDSKVALISRRGPQVRRTGNFDRILKKGTRGQTLDEKEVVQLFGARGEELARVCEVADEIRREVSGDTVSYVVTRNINYTNVCTYSCKFCAFSKGKTDEALRGRPYDLDLEEIARRALEAWDRGATEVCMQGGIHPDYTGAHYLAICKTVKKACPEMHVHAFSPLEVTQGAATLGISVREFLEQLKSVGLGSLPGTAAEILDDEVRRVLCPDKLSTAQWLETVMEAHRVGLRTTSTIMFGHVDRPVHWARHLLRLRELQSRTGGFTEFVPLPFVAQEAPIFLRGGARPGPTFDEAVLMHAIARIVLNPLIPNIQASWVKLGPVGIQTCLHAGVNDLGGTLMNESITRAAGSVHGQESTPGTIEGWIESVGRSARQRTTLYGDAPIKQVNSSMVAPELMAVVNTPLKKGHHRHATGR